MTALILKDCETWGDTAGELKLEVLSDDGEYARLFTPTSPEVVLSERLEDKSTLVIPLAFANLGQARRAGKLLAEAFDAVREIQAEPKPRPCGPLHQWHVSLFARNFDYVAVCERCGAVADLVHRVVTEGSA